MTEQLKEIILDEILRLSKIMHDDKLVTEGCQCGNCKNNMVKVFSFIINRLVMLYKGVINVSDFHDSLDTTPKELRVFYINLLFEEK
jgi:hypothetical protein